MNSSTLNCEDNAENILHLLKGARLGIVGGGWFCRKLFGFFDENQDFENKPQIMVVVDIDDQAAGVQYARQLGILTSRDYRELFTLADLQVVLEITRDRDLAGAIQEIKPDGVRLIDHFSARYLWEALEVEKVRLNSLAEFKAGKGAPDVVEDLLENNFKCFNAIMNKRNARSREIELELVEYQRTQAQIIQGSTIPTFVLNRDHVVTHWNKAIEKMTGWSADEMVGTNRQWAPFWDRERPTMADVILDQIDEAEIEKLYGSQWRKSGLIDGAYEAEILFPQMGQGGKWLWFTAAPIKAPDGIIVGAIET
ncbi:MAG: PAS domain-containing protein, partial [Desulfosarcinaceae bacterium]